MQGKWLVQSDDYGNLYFYNTITGESVWELPEEEENEDQQDKAVEVEVAKTTNNQHNAKIPELERPQAHYSVYAIAVGVADTMVNIVETIENSAEKLKNSKIRRKFVSPAAEKRFLKNKENEEKKKRHLRDRTITAYISVLVPKIEPGGAGEGGEKRRQVRTLFTAEESRRWQRERELERSQATCNTTS